MGLHDRDPYGAHVEGTATAILGLVAAGAINIRRDTPPRTLFDDATGITRAISAMPITGTATTSRRPNSGITIPWG
jgi:hypothetical protein